MQNRGAGAFIWGPIPWGVGTRDTGPYIYIYTHTCHRILIQETYFKHDPNPQKTIGTLIRKPTDSCQQNQTSFSQICCSTTRGIAIAAPHKTPRTTQGTHENSQKQQQSHKTMAKNNRRSSGWYPYLIYSPSHFARHSSAAGLRWRSGAGGLEGRLGLGESGGVAGAGAGTARGPGPKGWEGWKNPAEMWEKPKEKAKKWVNRSLSQGKTPWEMEEERLGIVLFYSFWLVNLSESSRNHNWWGDIMTFPAKWWLVLIPATNSAEFVSHFSFWISHLDVNPTSWRIMPLW